jgi:16S rRNA (cytosine967-C5)-methyltransferase
MAVSTARAAAFDILLQVEREDAYASELLHSNRYEKLSTADHGLATEIVMGVLRWRTVLDSELARFSSQKLEKLDREVLVSLRMAAFQLSQLDRVPAHAAVHESVELVKRARKRSAVPFANALLRRVSGHAEWIAEFRKTIGTLAENSAPDTKVDLAQQFAHPKWMIERWIAAYGRERTREVVRFDQQIPTTAIRLSAAADKAALKKNDVTLLDGALLKSAARVGSGNVTSTELFRAGRITIQDEASQLVALLVGNGEAILDCCAAPGGKTRVISDNNPRARVVALELHPHRARLLRKMVRATNVGVVCGDIRQAPIQGLFDRVLVDVPCSGTGTLQRNPEIKWRLTPKDLLDLQSKQIAILASAMNYVAPKGRLIYSTCSLEPEENQAVIEKALAQDSSFEVRNCRIELELLRDQEELVWGDIDSLLSGPFLRTIPGVHQGDGFFAAILEKK